MTLLDSWRNLVLGTLALGGFNPAFADPAVLRVGRDTAGLVLTWTAPGTLKTASSPSGPWVGIANAQSPFRISPATTTAFFRIEPQSNVVTSNPFINGDFEQGPLVGWAQEPGQVIFPTANLSGATPFSGQYAVWLGYNQDSRKSARLGQRVTLPNVRPLYLNFALWLHSEESCDVPYYDALTVYINGTVAAKNDGVCQGTVADQWQKVSVDITQLAGTVATFVFEISSVDNLASVALLDDIAVGERAWGE